MEFFRPAFNCPFCDKIAVTGCGQIFVTELCKDFQNDGLLAEMLKREKEPLSMQNAYHYGQVWQAECAINK